MKKVSSYKCELQIKERPIKKILTMNERISTDNQLLTFSSCHHCEDHDIEGNRDYLNRN